MEKSQRRVGGADSPGENQNYSYGGRVGSVDSESSGVVGIAGEGGGAVLGEE